LSAETRTECERLWEASLTQLAEALKAPDDDYSKGIFAIDVCVPLTETQMRLSNDRKPGMDRLFAILSEGMPGSAVPLLYKGVNYKDYAWDARGSGWANTVTEDGWKNMKERLATAEEALTAAWKIDPEDTRFATEMIGVELGQGKGREHMELWFKRAMEAAPFNFEACKKKLYYLEPKWHGSREEMLDFGHELLADGNWEARLPLILVDAHFALARYEKGQAYWTTQGVWEDVQAVYEAYLKFDPDSTHDRSMYAKLACWCGQWTAAHAQFQKLGDKVKVGVFQNAKEMQTLRAEAATKAKP
jgi:hypothetical protein